MSMPETRTIPPVRRPGPRVRTVALATIVCLVFGTAGVGVGLFIAAVRAGAINPYWTDSNVSASQARAERIIDALRAYHASFGVYPESLSPLTPDFIDRVPSPSAGADAWSYASTNAGDDFILRFSANEFGLPTAWYESRHGRWFAEDLDGMVE